MHYETTPPAAATRRSDTREDRSLAARAEAGDRDAFVQVMQQHNQRLFRLAIAILGDRTEAEDVLQEAYLRAFGRMNEYSGEGRLGAWLASIVRHEAIDRLRVRRRRRKHVCLEADMRGTHSPDELPLNKACADEVFCNPAIELERSDMRRILEHEIALLPASFRTVFVIREVEGLSVEETAEYLGIPAATVKSRDFRARALLKARLGQQIDADLRRTFTFLNQDCASLSARVLNRLRH